MSKEATQNDQVTFIFDQTLWSLRDYVNTLQAIFLNFYMLNIQLFIFKMLLKRLFYLLNLKKDLDLPHSIGPRLLNLGFRT